MPLCSECHVERPRLEYSKAQLKKPAVQRRCNHCLMKQDVEEQQHQDDTVVKYNSDDDDDILVPQKKTHHPAATASNRSWVLLLIDEVVPLLFQRGIPPNLGQLMNETDGNNASHNNSIITPTILRRRLVTVLQQQASMLWLAIPLLEGLLYQGDHLQRRVFVPGSNEPFPLLTVLVQFQLLKRQFQYKGSNDLVALTLRAGAPVNEALGNGCTALFFAVKYGNATTLELLQQAGASLAHTDIYGQTCWKNAVESPEPRIVQHLITWQQAQREAQEQEQQFLPEQNDNNNNNSQQQQQQQQRPQAPVSVRDVRIETEDDKTNNNRDQTPQSQSSSSLFMTLPDFMLHQFISVSSGSPTGDPFSWYLLGLPRLDDYALSFVRILQAGASYDGKDLNNIGLSVAVFAGSGGENHNNNGNNNNNAIVDFYLGSSSERAKKRALLQQMGRVVFGEWLPPVIQQEVRQRMNGGGDATEFHPNNNTNNNTNNYGMCLLCNQTMGDRDQPVTLYCGHSYCLECVKALRQDYHDQQQQQEEIRNSPLHKNNNNNKAANRIFNAACPKCNRKLGRDLLSPQGRELRPPSHLLGIDHRNEEESSEPRGPWVLTDKQLEVESQRRGIYNVSELTRAERLQEMDEEPKLPLTHLLELSSTTPFSVDGREYLAPLAGQACIPITVSGVPILAWLSPTSPLTVLSKEFMDTFGLKRKELSSTAFVQYDGSELDRFWAVPEFTFTLGHPTGRPHAAATRADAPIEIRLNNAICYQFGDGSDNGDGNNPPSPSNQQQQQHYTNDRPRGVQLGMDFFDSASWAQVSVLIDQRFEEPEEGEEEEPMYAIADGCGPIVITSDMQPQELRFYSRTGQMFVHDLIFVTNLNHEVDNIPIVSLPNDVEFTECDWCARCFPSPGMKECQECAKSPSGRVTYYCDDECQRQAQSIHEHG